MRDHGRVALRETTRHLNHVPATEESEGRYTTTPSQSAFLGGLRDDTRFTRMSSPRHKCHEPVETGNPYAVEGGQEVPYQWHSNEDSSSEGENRANATRASPNPLCLLLKVKGLASNS